MSELMHHGPIKSAPFNREEGEQLREQIEIQKAHTRKLFAPKTIDKKTIDTTKLDISKQP
jgi:hypothetical protein